MKEALRFACLDFYTIKPYVTLKNFLIFGVVGLALVISMKATAPLMGVLIMVGSTYISYPFASAEKNNLDTLYATLPIERKAVVAGRYLFALTLNSICMGTGLVLALLISYVLSGSLQWENNLLTMGVLMFVSLLINSLQLPFYFKMRYNKARNFTYLPFVFIMLLAVGVEGLFNSLQGFVNFETVNIFSVVLVVVLLLLGGLILSYKISINAYTKRSF